MLAKKLDINGEEFEYCSLHSSAAENELEAFAWCEAGDNPDCHPEREACPNFVQHLTDIIKDVKYKGNYVRLLFPREVDYPSTIEGDVRLWTQRFENDLPVGEPEPLNYNENPDGTYNFDCSRCDRECGKCSGNKHCICDPPCGPYDYGDEDDEWDEPEGII